jgi:mannose-6-phosphate isomerase
LHIDNAVAVANAHPIGFPSSPTRLTEERTVLVASRHFVLERVDLQEASSWALLAEPETWVLVLDGHAAIGLGRIAYPATRSIVSLLQRLCEPSTLSAQPTAVADPKWTALPEART